MIQNRTWDLVPPHPSQNVVTSRWLFTTKNLANGEVDRPKGMLVARGFNERDGVDYAETFSPVIKSKTIWTVLDIAVKNNWSIKQLDVNNAFLQGDLADKVYSLNPPASLIQINRITSVNSTNPSMVSIRHLAPGIKP